MWDVVYLQTVVGNGETKAVARTSSSHSRFSSKVVLLAAQETSTSRAEISNTETSGQGDQGHKNIYFGKHVHRGFHGIGRVHGCY